MSILKLMAAQEAAFDTLTDVLTNPNEYDTELQNLRANLALAVVNMVPAGAFDFAQQVDGAVEAAEQFAELVTPDFGEQQDEIQDEEQAALAQVTTLPNVPMNPHGAPPLGGAG